jgi:hypothetical protein
MCSSDALGPCSQNAVELAGDTFQVIEISASNLLPQAESEQPQNLIVDLQDRFRLAGQGRVLGPRESDEKDAASAYLEVAASGKVAEASFSSDSSVVAQGVVRDFTPTLPFSVADVADNQLVWGRFGVGRGVSERLSVERLVAAEARSITIAASDYLLYRTEVSGARVKANSGIVGFKLDSAQAFYNAGGGDVSLSVTDGVLDVNFVANSFSTALNFDHPNIGELRFSGTGRIADGGYLIGLQEKQSVLGAVATDGSEAGYFFEQQLDAGFISGLTLWGGR